jgi:PA14 domain
MKPNRFILLSAALLLAGGPAGAQTFTGADLGTPTLPGSAVVNADGTITITGGGADIWGTADGGYYYYTKVSGQAWNAVMRVQSLTGPDNWSKCELMVRQDDGSGAAFPQADDAFIAQMTTRTGGQNEVGEQYRAVANGSANWQEDSPVVRPTYPNTWLRVQRFGSVFRIQQGTDGKNWDTYITIDTATTATPDFNGVPWPDPIYVGAAVTAHNDSDANGAVAVVSDLSITPITSAKIGIAQDVQNMTTTVGGEVTFSCLATNDADAPVVYQWYMNGNVVSNAVSTAGNFTFLATAAESGAQISCKATVPGISSASVTSGTATLTVNPSTVYTNGLKMEYFSNATRPQVEAGTVAAADYIALAPDLDQPGGLGNNYVTRYSGYFIPPTSDTYVFFLACDDDADLYLSTDETPANKQIIAQAAAWSPQDSWLADGAGAPTVAQRSDLWTDPTTFAPAWTQSTPLTAGKRYYIELVHHQGGGGDNVSVTYQTQTQIMASDWSTVFTNGTPSLITAANKNLALMTTPETTLTWSQQPADVTAFQANTVAFTAAVNTDSELQPLYQWYRDGQPVTNATGTALSIGPLALSDSGAKIFATAQTPISGLSITSSVATLTVVPASLELGRVKDEFWSTAENMAGVENGTMGSPTWVTTVPGFEAGVNVERGDYYTERLSGFFIPATSGNYVFFVAADDQADVFLSTDDTPANKRMVAQETGWDNSYQWITDNGGNGANFKRSDQWTDANGNTPYASGIPLVAGQKYYMEAVHQEGTGGDHVEVTAVTTAQAATIADGDDTTLQGNVVGFYAPGDVTVTFTQQPQDTSATSGTTASFSATGTSDSTISISGIGLPTTNNFIIFQWFKNGTAIAGATASSYTTPMLLPQDNGAQFTCGLRAIGLETFSNSQPATLTVITDTVPPTIAYAATYVNTFDNSGNSSTFVDVAFSKRMDLASLLQMADYTVAGATVSAITVNSNDFRTVELTVSGTPTSVSVSGVKSFSEIPIAAGASMPVKQVPLTLTDIGTPTVDPLLPSTMFVTGANAYTITSGGSDIWNNNDGCGFLYEQKSGDFDVVVRQESITHSDNWAKGGLMARETLDMGSRDWNIVNDPLSSDGIAAADGSGNGASLVEANSRVSTAGASAGWETASQPAPAYPNAWVRLKRTGNVFNSYYSTNGVSWTLLGTQDATQVGDSNALPASLYVGIAVTAHIDPATYYDPTTYPKYMNTSAFDGYNSSYVPPTPGPTLTASLSGANIVISWAPSGGTLQSTTALGGAWTAVGTANPATVPMSGNAMFFRVSSP